MLAAMASLVNCTGVQGDRSAPSTNAAQITGTAENWASHGGGSDEAGYSRLDQIRVENAEALGLANWLDLDGEATLEATPLAVDGVLYFTGSYSSVYAVDAATGTLRWKYDPQIWKVNPAKMGMNFGVNRGVAYADGRVFVGVLDGRLVALDAATGKEQWSVDTLPPRTLHTITGAPRTFNGKVIIGNAGADANQRGYVTAYDQVTGRQLWRFYTVPGSPEANAGDPAMEMAAKTWGGEFWKQGLGGTVWNGITFDPELNRIYLGTGNGGPYNPKLRSPGGGDNLFLASIVALDADSGKYIWHYQVNPGEAWDYKATANMILATLPIDGAPRKVLMQAPTNGFFYVIDRETGKLISAEKTGKVTWAERIDLKTGRPVEAANIRYETGESILYPSMLGTHNWQDMSYNPKTGLVYIPYMKLGARYSTSVKPGELAFGGMTVQAWKQDPDDGTGALLAWDPVKQEQRWKVPIETLWNGGTLTTAGGLVFQGTADGYFSAYDAKTGKRVWRFNAGLGIIAAPISYVAGGKQYVSVLVGYGGTTAALSHILDVGWKYGAQPRRLLTFAIGGTGKLPPSPGRDMTVRPLDDPSITLDEKSVAKGQGLSIMCMACHGANMHSAGTPGPDLRESAIAMSEDDLWTVLHDGAMIERGMPAFPQLTRGQVHNLWSYIRATAREANGTRKTSEVQGASRF
ncbi:PQQ-dependent dehydrogenase, methanol/ethanol family [Sphingomonas cavernae]|uniref:PQQ-dependent dehydrogenase, methanol/ethanol family n=2 Tax=Sphingomonas cavernae TaxID=2320861 RepID=A0A418WSA1_9SPHN|nr:PQQ-dependent dehydrogenase, methanol/ethanol family [Sphingomonas cavernae]